VDNAVQPTLGTRACERNVHATDSASVMPGIVYRLGMKKTIKTDKHQPLKLAKETIVRLGTKELEHVAGGNNSTRKSQCPTLCFT
jgi:hypothetical protein